MDELFKSRTYLIIIFLGICAVTVYVGITSNNSSHNQHSFEETFTAEYSNDDRVRDSRFVAPFEHGSYESEREWRQENMTQQLDWQIKENRVEVMWEITQFPEAELRSKDLENAWKFYRETFDAAEKNNWFNWEDAEADATMTGRLTDSIIYTMII